MSALSAVALVGFRGGDPAGDATVVEVIEVRRTSPFDAAIRVAADHDGEGGDQQHIGQLVKLPLRPAWIKDVHQYIQQRREHSHDNA